MNELILTITSLAMLLVILKIIDVIGTYKNKKRIWRRK